MDFTHKMFLCAYLFLFNFSIEFSFAQERFYEPGVIISIEGDTTTGYIKRVRDAELSLEVLFKDELMSESEQAFAPDELKGFMLTSDQVSFESVPYQFKKDSVTVKTTRFARKLAAGKLSLYKLQLPEEEQKKILINDNTFVYIIEKEGKHRVMERREYMAGSSYKVINLYVGVLNLVMSDCESFSQNLQNRIANLKFRDKDVVNLVSAYNSCGDPQAETQTFLIKNKTIVKKGIEISYVHLDTMMISNKVGLSIGGFFDILTPAINEKVSFMIGFNYLNLRFDRAGERINRHYLRVPVSATVNLAKEPVVPILGLGITPYLSNIDALGVGAFVNVVAGCYIQNVLVSCTFETDKPNSDGIRLLSFKLGYTF